MKTYDETLRKTGLLGSVLILMLTAIMLFVQGCSEKPTSPTIEKAIPKAGIEARGGFWKTVLIPSGSAYLLPPPPEKNSLQALNELNEMQSYQLKKSKDIINSIKYWDGLAIIRWNEITRHLVVKNGTNPPMASRAYALLSAAQYDALIAAWYNKNIYLRESPSGSSEPCYPCEQAVIASVSKRVLSYLFPKDADSINYWAAQETSSQLYTGKNYISDITSGDTLGAIIAAVFINYAVSDGHDAVWTGTVPSFPGCWFSSMNPPQQPMLPMWGKVKPWLMRSLLPMTPPPVFGSDEFKAALQEVKKISDTRTDEQLRIAKFWSDGAGTATPPGHWNEIASSYIITKNMDELRTARAFALMNMAIMDAGICCWDAKYKFWYIRPSQVDTTITTPVGLPNFPSYTSGHSSFSGAAHTVLGYLFPEKADEFKKMAEEAAISRLYGGIHYRFDSDMGLESGRAVGNLAVQRGMSDGSENWNF